MAILPELEHLKDAPYNMSTAQIVILMSFQWIIILLNIVLLILIVVNFRSILVKRENWKTLPIPLLLFYVVSFICVTLRLLVMGGQFSQANWWWLCFVIQPNAKICVGLIQTWMIFELSMKFRQTNNECLNCWKKVVMLLITSFFCIETLTMVIILLVNSDNSIADDDQEVTDRIFELNMYLFLVLLIVMLSVNIDLLH